MTELEPFAPIDLDRPPAMLTRSQGERMGEWLDLFLRTEPVAKVLAQTDFVPAGMRDKPAAVAAAMLKGFELGIDPLDALGSIYVIHGRVGFYAEYMRRRVLEFGHRYRIVDNTDARCAIEGCRRGEQDWQRFSFTADMAKRAKIDISAYPADKLLARATTRMVRGMFPDVLSGSVIVEDLEDGLIPTGPNTDTPPAPIEAPRTAQRTTRRRTAPPPRQTASPATFEAAPPPPLPGDEETIVEPEPEPASDEDDTADTEQADEPDADPDQIALGDPPPDDEPCTRAQQTKLNILLKAEGLESREAKLDYLEAQFGGKFTSSKELSLIEASRLIDFLEDAQTRDTTSGER